MVKKSIKPKKGARKGFTIIEVVLVLAIAGLIFLMVFIALPALQSGQRNAQRESDLGRMLNAVTEYQSNNSGRLPFATGTNPDNVNNLVMRYIDTTCKAENDYNNPQNEESCTGDQFRDPDGTIYHFDVLGAFADAVDNGEVSDIAAAFGTGDLDADHAIYVVTGATCGENERTAIKGTGSRQVALFMVLEGNSVACNSNS